MAVKTRGSIQSKKGQAVTPDFIFAIILLAIIIQVAIIGWDRSLDRLHKRETRLDIENLAFTISDMLVKTSGMPTDWVENNVTTIGLADETNVLSPAKVAMFTNLEKQKAKKLLGIVGYDFSFTLRNNGDVVVECGDRWNTAEEIIVARRLILYNGSPMLMEFRLWGERW